MTRPNFPDALEDLHDTLVAMGFEVKSMQRGGMGGFDLVLVGHVTGKSSEVPASVNINADRGFWSLGIKLGPMATWDIATTWRSYLDGVPMMEQSIDEQARFVKDRIRDMAVAVESDPNVEAALNAIGEPFMRKYYGLE